MNKEELKIALEKFINSMNEPKVEVYEIKRLKPIKDTFCYFNVVKCPNCKTMLFKIYDIPRCHTCLTELDWSDYE